MSENDQIKLRTNVGPDDTCQWHVRSKIGVWHRVFVLRCHSASHLTCFVSFHRVHLSYVIIQSYNHLRFIQSNKSHSFIQLRIHTWIFSHINAYTTYTQNQLIHGCISHPQSCLTVSHQLGLLLVIILGRKFLKNKHLAFTFLLVKNVIPIVSGPEMSLIISPVDFGGFFMKPSGFWRTLVKCFTKAEWILANLLSKAEWILANLLPSRVDSHKCLSKAEWILTNLLSKVEWILANVYQEPSGFSQTFVLSPVNSGETFYKTEWISGKLS